MGRITFTDFEEGGGLLDDVDVTIARVQCVMGNYGGARTEEAPMAIIGFEDSAGEVHEQYYSAGKATDLIPTKDGSGFDSPTGKTKLHGSSNLGMLLKSAITAGFPSSKIGGDLSALVGTHCHVKREVVKRTSIGKDTSVLVIDKIYSLPGEGKSGKGKGKVGAESDEFTQLVTDVVVGIVSEKGSIKKTSVLTTLFKADELKNHPRKKEIADLIADEGFYKNAGLTVENGVITL